MCFVIISSAKMNNKVKMINNELKKTLKLNFDTNYSYKTNICLYYLFYYLQSICKLQPTQ